MSMPLAPTSYPGIERIKPTPVYAGSGVTPRTVAVQLPAYGIFDIVVIAWHGNPNQAASITARVTWFKFDSTVGAQQNLQAKSTVIGTVARSTGGTTATQITDITVGDPSSTGAFNVGIVFTGADINPRVIVRGIKLAATGDFSL